MSRVASAPGTLYHRSPRADAARLTKTLTGETSHRVAAGLSSVTPARPRAGCASETQCGNRRTPSSSPTWRGLSQPPPPRFHTPRGNAAPPFRRSASRFIFSSQDEKLPARRDLAHVGHPGADQDRVAEQGGDEVLDEMRPHNPAAAQRGIRLDRPPLTLSMNRCRRMSQRRRLHPLQVRNVVRMLDHGVSPFQECGHQAEPFRVTSLNS